MSVKICQNLWKSVRIRQRQSLSEDKVDFFETVYITLKCWGKWSWRWTPNPESRNTNKENLTTTINFLANIRSLCTFSSRRLWCEHTAQRSTATWLHRPGAPHRHFVGMATRTWLVRIVDRHDRRFQSSPTPMTKRRDLHTHSHGNSVRSCAHQSTIDTMPFR